MEKAETGTAELPRRFHLRLPERFEDDFLLFFRNPDTCITNVNFYLLSVIRYRDPVGYRPFIGKLYRVAEEIDHYLFDPVRITEQPYPACLGQVFPNTSSRLYPCILANALFA
jgi:hypothetical protein